MPRVIVSAQAAYTVVQSPTMTPVASPVASGDQVTGEKSLHTGQQHPNRSELREVRVNESAPTMAAIGPAPGRKSTAYNLFILVMTIVSLVITVLLLLRLDEQTIILLRWYDNAICLVSARVLGRPLCRFAQLPPGGLAAHELEVLRQVASGRSNR